MEMLRRFFREEDGANLVEYALLITLIAVVVITGAGALGTNINDWFSKMGGAVTNWSTNVP